MCLCYYLYSEWHQGNKIVIVMRKSPPKKGGFFDFLRYNFFLIFTWNKKKKSQSQYLENIYVYKKRMRWWTTSYPPPHSWTLSPESVPRDVGSSRHREVPDPQVPNHSAREHEPTGPKRHQSSRKPPSSWRSCQRVRAGGARKPSPAPTTWTWSRWRHSPTPPSRWQGDCRREQPWSDRWRPSTARTHSRHHLPHHRDRWHSSRCCHAKPQRHGE